MKVKVSDVQNFTLKPSIEVKVTAATYTLVYDGNLTSGTMALKPNLIPIAKPTSLNFAMSIPTLFTNYETIVEKAEAVGATVQFSLTEEITGVSIVNNVLTIDKTYSNPDPAKDIVVAAKVIAKNTAGEDVELVVAKETTFTLTDVSGTWAAPR